MPKTTFTLDHFGGNRFALVQTRTHEDILTDYHPGIWGIETQKKALLTTIELLNCGHKVAIGLGDKVKIENILKKAEARKNPEIV